MRYRIAILFLIAGVGLSLPGASSASATQLLEQSIREVPPDVVLVSGQVEQSGDGGTTWTPLAMQDRVDAKALVRTGADGTCVLLCKDLSLIAMMPGATIQVLPQAKELRLALSRGEVLVRFDRVAENDRNAVGLEHAIAFARGAGSFSFNASDSTSLVKVLAGTLAVASGPGVPADSSAGQAITGSPGGLQPAIHFDASQETARWESLVARAGLSVTTVTPNTNPAGTSTSRPLRPDGPVGTPAGVFIMLGLMGAGAVIVLTVIGLLIYLGVNRRRRRSAGRAASR